MAASGFIEEYPSAASVSLTTLLGFRAQIKFVTAINNTVTGNGGNTATLGMFQPDKTMGIPILPNQAYTIAVRDSDDVIFVATQPFVVVADTR